MDFILKLFFYLFLLSCVFDPADKLFGLKVPLFISCWVIFFISKKSFSLKFPKELVNFILFFLIIPTISILYYLIFDGSEPFGGFSLFKSFLLISLSFILFDKKINLIPALSRVLSALSFAIIIMYVVILLNPFLFAPIFDFGFNYGIFHI